MKNLELPLRTAAWSPEIAPCRPACPSISFYILYLYRLYSWWPCDLSWSRTAILDDVVMQLQDLDGDPAGGEGLQQAGRPGGGQLIPQKIQEKW